MKKAEKIKILEEAINDLSSIRETILDLRDEDTPNHIGFHAFYEQVPEKIQARLDKYNSVIDGLEEMYDEILPELIATMRTFKKKSDEEVWQEYENR